MTNSVAFNTFRTLHNYHLYLLLERFHHPKSRPHSHEQSLPMPLSQPLATTSLLSVAVDLPVPDIPYSWNHTLHGLSCLASFTQYDVFKIHLHCSLCRRFTPFYSRVIFHCVGGPRLFNHSLMDTGVLSTVWLL